MTKTGGGRGRSEKRVGGREICGSQIPITGDQKCPKIRGGLRRVSIVIRAWIGNEARKKSLREEGTITKCDRNRRGEGRWQVGKVISSCRLTRKQSSVEEGRKMCGGQGDGQPRGT